jgi:hypothetical protein
MSNKTIFKRVALVAITALGSGLLTVAPAQAAAPDDLAAGDIQLASTTATPGVCKVDTTTGEQDITVVAGRTFLLNTTSGGSGEKAYIKLAGNVTVSSSTGWSAATLTTLNDTAAGSLSPDTLYANTGDSATILAGAVGTGTLTISSTSTSAAIEVIAVTVVASCANNVLDLAETYAQLRTYTTGDATSNNDLATTFASSATAYLHVATNDTYGNNLTGTGVLIATATNGAIVSWDGAASNQVSTAISTARGSDNIVYITKPTATSSAPLSTVVTVTLDGVTITAKSLKFRGVPATIEIKDVTVGKIDSVGVFRARVFDSAGNALPSVTVSDDATANAATATAAITTGVSAAAVTLTDGDWSASTQGQFTCTKGGTATLNVRATVSSIAGTYVNKSFPIACGGALATWTISMDKAVYAPGEIAVFTVTGKDANGFPVNTTDTLGTLVEAFTGGEWVSTPVTGDKFDSAAGVKNYSLKIGNTEGSYVGSFKITGSVDTKAKTVTYKVASATPTVTNAEVLKSIVALIASINKQIQALQKLILKRK